MSLAVLILTRAHHGVSIPSICTSVIPPIRPPGFRAFLWMFSEIMANSPFSHRALLSNDTQTHRHGIFIHLLFNHVLCAVRCLNLGRYVFFRSNWRVGGIEPRRRRQIILPCHFLDVFLVDRLPDSIFASAYFRRPLSVSIGTISGY